MEEMRYSQDKWKYVIIVSKFILLFLEVAITKSFGVLIPTMVYMYSTDVSSLGFVCSMPTSMMYISCLPMAYVLKSGRISPRMMAVIGAVISSLGIIIAGLMTSVVALGFCLAITGIGLSMGYLPSKVLLNDYFRDDFVLMNSISNLGSTTGSLVVPVIIEKALEAYGFSGAMLILGGISLHAIVASVTLRPKECSRSSTRTKRGKKVSQEMTEKIPLVNVNHDNRIGNVTIDDSEMVMSGDEFVASSKEISRYKEDNTERASTDENVLSTKDRLWHWIRHCIFAEEPLLALALPILFLMSFVIQSWTLFLVPRAMWHGVPSSKAVLLSSIGGGAGVIGRILSIVLLYFGADFILAYLILSVVLSMTFLLDPLLTSFPVMCVSAFIQGLCVFSSGMASSAFLKSAVSDQNFTVAAGIIGLVFGLGGNVGSLLSGMIKDKTGSYTTVFLALGVINCVTVLITIAFMVARRRRNIKRA